MKFDLTVESREGGGKGPARQLRRAGRVPAVLYGQGECLLLSVKPDELVKILRRARPSVLRCCGNSRSIRLRAASCTRISLKWRWISRFASKFRCT
mgnify:CR=1 FL=1